MAAEEYLAVQRSKASPETAELWAEMESYYKKKLWHQLTVFIENNLRSPMFQVDGLLVLYDKFISKFEDRINYLSFVKLLLEVSKEHKDPAASIEYLSRYRDKVKKSDQALLLLLSSIAELHLSTRDLVAAKELIDQCTPIVDNLNGVTPVHYAYYRVCAHYYKAKADFAAFYADALRYLGCVDLATVPKGEQIDWAFDLGIAGLLGDTIYNFGELLSHPILQSLAGTDREWLIRLLQAYNAGDAATVASLQSSWSSNVNLSSSLPQLRDKLKLLSLMELVYRAPAHERSLPFASIAAAAGVPLEEVETLTMRGLSRGLVKGSIDGVDGIAHLHWVQPRVLDQRQLTAMHDNLQKWIGTVRQASTFVSTHGSELLVE
jgi:26S proteasome regulatory subunit N9